jgi:C1A family cysteine protease
MSIKKHTYGWKKDKKDVRDFKFSPRESIVLPPLIDLRRPAIPVLDQKNIGSCTANAIAMAHLYEQFKQTQRFMIPSRLFIYYNERDMEGTIGEDSGAQIRDGIKSVNQLGVCNEKMWTYDTTKFTQKPTDDCYADALENQVTLYLSVNQTSVDMCTCLSLGYPFVFGFVVYKSFEDEEVATTGRMSMPGWFDSQVGGHAVICVGYDFTDSSNKVWIVQNSWSDSWGDKGFFYMPHNYLLKESLSSDFWTIRLVETENQ